MHKNTAAGINPATVRDIKCNNDAINIERH